MQHNRLLVSSALHHWSHPRPPMLHPPPVLLWREVRLDRLVCQSADQPYISAMWIIKHALFSMYLSASLHLEKAQLLHIQYVYNKGSGYYFHQQTGLYYDPSSQVCLLWSHCMCRICCHYPGVLLHLLLVPVVHIMAWRESPNSPETKKRSPVFWGAVTQGRTVQEHGGGHFSQGLSFKFPSQSSECRKHSPVICCHIPEWCARCLPRQRRVAQREQVMKRAM